MCSVAAGYLCLHVTVIETPPLSTAPTWGVSLDVAKNCPGPVALTLPQMESYSQLVRHLLSFLFGGRHVEHGSSVPEADKIKPGCFSNGSPKFPNHAAEGVGRAVLDGA